MDKLDKHFPFANYMVKDLVYQERKERLADPADYVSLFELMIGQLYQYRNFYSHAVHDPVNMNTTIINGMNVLIDAVDSWTSTLLKAKLMTIRQQLQSDINKLEEVIEND